MISKEASVLSDYPWKPLHHQGLYRLLFFMFLLKKSFFHLFPQFFFFFLISTFFSFPIPRHYQEGTNSSWYDDTYAYIYGGMCAITVAHELLSQYKVPSELNKSSNNKTGLVGNNSYMLQMTVHFPFKHCLSHPPETNGISKHIANIARNFIQLQSSP